MEQKDISTISPDSHNEEYLKFVFYQAEKRLEDSNKSYEYTTTKTVIAISLSVGLLSASLAYIFSNLDFNGFFCPKLATVIFLSVYVFSLLFVLGLNLFSFKYQPAGSYPEDLFIDRPTGMKEDIFYKKVVYEEIKNYNERINFNYSKNKARVKRLDFVIIALVLMPIFLVAFYSISTCLS